MKDMSKYPNVTFDAIAKEWDKVAATGVKVPLALHAKLASNSIESMAMDSPLQVAECLSVSKPSEDQLAANAGLKWGFHCLADMVVQAEVCEEAGVKVFGHVPPYSLPKEASLEASLNTTEKFVFELHGKLQLPPVTQTSLGHITTLMQSVRPTGPSVVVDKFQRAIEAASEAQNPSGPRTAS